MKKKLTLLMAVVALVLHFSASAQNLKGDPWIFQVYKELYNRQPQAWELNIKLYNQGSWRNYAELKNFVQQYQASLSQNGLTTRTIPLKGNQTSAVLFDQAGKSIAVNLVSNEGGNVIAAGGANVIAAGGGNVIAAGGGNVIAAGGGNLKDLAGAQLGSSRQLMAGDKKIVKTSGSGAIIIR